MRAQSFARTMHNEATKSLSVTAHGEIRECKELSAPGEVPSETLSDAGSTPAGSTKLTWKLLGLLILINLIISRFFNALQDH